MMDIVSLARLYLEYRSDLILHSMEFLEEEITSGIAYKIASEEFADAINPIEARALAIRHFWVLSSMISPLPADQKVAGIESILNASIINQQNGK